MAREGFVGFVSVVVEFLEVLGAWPSGPAVVVRGPASGSGSLSWSSPGGLVGGLLHES